MQNDDMKRELDRVEKTLHNIRDAEDRYTSLSLQLEKLKALVLHTAAQSFHSPPLRSVHNDLGRLLFANGIRIMAIEKSDWVSDSAADGFFTRHRSRWKLNGSFRRYMAFKEVLATYRGAVVHVDEEKISRGEGNILNIEIHLSVYQFESV